MIPYTLRGDDWITTLLLGCFLFSAYILAHAKKIFLQQIKDFFHHKERASIFVASTASDVRFQLFLVVQTSILLAICSFDYFMDTMPGILSGSIPYRILGIYVLMAIGYYLVKWLVYLFLGWIFFDKNLVNQWGESYSLVIYCLGFTLFPSTLLIVYFDLSVNKMLICGISLVIFAKLFLFYKWVKFFFNRIYGISLLIVYFCALEIVPCFILYQGMVQINYMLEIKI
ncbi:MAG: DUF4271 domain-containing protein [Bacteroides sp.]|nr:DUF4271 domain-containing protein [Bacteroides sp.]